MINSLLKLGLNRDLDIKTEEIIMTAKTLRTLLLSFSAAALLPLTACSQSAADSDVKTAPPAPQASADLAPTPVNASPNQTPIPEDALNPNAHSDHDGYDHGAHAAPAAPVVNADAPIGTYAPVANDHSIGAADAPVSMIVYASVTCPHCAAWFTNDYPILKRDYIDTGKMRMVFREFPTAPTQVAVAGFMIAGCGPEDQFIDNVEYQMLNQKKILEGLQAGRVQETFEGIGAQNGLDFAAIEACLSNESNFDSIKQAMTFAQAGNLGSVPAFIIDGKVYDYKSASAESLSTLIDDATR